MKISQKVPIVASVIVIVAFTIFSWFQYNMVRNALYEKLESNITETSAVLTNQITNWLNGKLALIDMMAGYISVDYSPETVQEVMDNQLLKNEFSLIFGALELNGKPISNTPTWAPPAGWDGRKRAWYPLARSQKRAVLTDPYADSATGDILISAVANIEDQGAFKGAFGGDLSLKTVSNAVNTLNFNNTGYAFLLNSNREIISHPDSSLNGKQLNALFTKDEPSLGTDIQELELNSNAVLVRFSPLEGLDSKEWLIGVVLDKNKAMAEADTLKLMAVIGALVSALVSSLVLYFTMARLFLTPINNLIKIADEISLGKLDVKITETERKDEIGALALAIDRMGVSIQHAIKRLQKK